MCATPTAAPQGSFSESSVRYPESGTGAAGAAHVTHFATVRIAAMLPAMHRLDGGRTAAANAPLDLSASLSRKEKRSLKRGQTRARRSQKKPKAKPATADDANDAEADANATNAPVIIATSQQSRFHTVTFDEFGKNVLLNQFTLAIGAAAPDGSADPVGVVELLRDTQLKLNYGSRYGLVGPNGIGKSTLLTALADGLVEGLPTSLKILYVNQLDTSSLTPESAQQSVLQTVLSADTRVSELQHKIDILQNALVESSEPEKERKKFASYKAELLHALLRIQLMEAEEAEVAASKTAINRSGMLGKDARLRLLEVEHKVADLRQRLQFTLLNEDGEHESVVAAYETDILHEIHKKMEEFQQALKVLDQASMEARARRILSSMNVDAAKQDAPLSSLSGGWQVRILLARVLFMEPDFLLLDEPTNHLDMPSILWLKDYLLSLDDVLGTPVTLVVVSHDRFFLNAVTEETIFFRAYDKTLAYYEGSYDSFEKAMATKRQFNARLQTKLDKKTEQMSAMVSKISQQAARSKDDKKMQVAASKKKKMDRIGVERSAKGTRFKLNRDRIGYFLSDRDQAEDQAKYDETEGGNSASSAWRILSSCPPQIRNLTKLDNTTMISLENVSFRYDTTDTGNGTGKPKLPLVLENLNLTINYGDKVVLVGRNGAGKTTFMKLLSHGLEPNRGKVEYFHGARVSSLMQHNVEDLKRQEWSRRLTPLELLRTRLQEDEAGSQLTTSDLGTSGANDGKIRGHLSSFGITSGAAVAVPLNALSGGQLVRVGLAWATFPYPPHVLLLDEPTNHLDMSTIQLLGEALRKYQGAVVLLSHDLHFLNVLTNGSQRDEGGVDAGDDNEGCGRVRVFEVSKKKGIVSLLPLTEGVDSYREKEERRNASLGLNFGASLPIMELLLEHGADMELVDSLNHTALSCAISRKKTAAAILLAQNGASANRVGYHGRTPLQSAIKKKLLEVTKELLKHGANPHVRSESYKVARDFIPSGPNHDKFVELLDTYASTEPAIIDLTLPTSAVDSTEEDLFSIDRAIHTKSTIAVSAILQATLDNEDLEDMLSKYESIERGLENTDDENWRSLLTGIEIKYEMDLLIKVMHSKTLARLKELVNRIAKPDWLRNMKLDEDWTPLHLAVSINSPPIVQYLLVDCGLNPLVLSSDNKLSLDIALESECDSGMCWMLLQHMKKRAFSDRASMFLSTEAVSLDGLHQMIGHMTSVYDLRLILSLGFLALSPAEMHVALLDAFEEVIREKLVFDDSAAVFFKLGLQECMHQGYISEAEQVEWDLKATKVNIENSDWVRDIKRSLYEVECKVRTAERNIELLHIQFSALRDALIEKENHEAKRRTRQRLVSLISSALVMCGGLVIKDIFEALFDLWDPAKLLSALTDMKSTKLAEFLAERTSTVIFKDGVEALLLDAAVDPVEFAVVLRDTAKLEQADPTVTVPTTMHTNDKEPTRPLLPVKTTILRFKAVVLAVMFRAELASRSARTIDNQHATIPKSTVASRAEDCLSEEKLESYPFHYAVRFSEGAIEQFLELVYYIDENDGDINDTLPVFVCSAEPHSETNEWISVQASPVVYASYFGYVDIVKWFLERPDVIATEKNNKFIGDGTQCTTSTSLMQMISSLNNAEELLPQTSLDASAESKYKVPNASTLLAQDSHDNVPSARVQLTNSPRPSRSRGRRNSAMRYGRRLLGDIINGRTCTCI
ncbi:unnamed protein product [Phytophthora lilii]|uniref:Unnamed protein product n=1 Tax=Phytophthora lilii TaxID=2077276 RepID=A0A9W6TFZ1_9STRA|nr:unnamed protein product [Phytophthora lilii]